MLWNRPLGAFEIPPLDSGTNEVGQHVGELTIAVRLMSVAGGGDTLAALPHASVLNEFSRLNCRRRLEWLEGKTLPSVAVLQRS